MTYELRSILSFHQLGDRTNQEDSRWPDSDNPGSDCKVFAVCDGVGGCNKGEVASATVCRAIGQWAKGYDPSRPLTDDAMALLLGSAYKALDRACTPTNEGMATTLTLVVFNTLGVIAAHIGDSRIYHIRPGKGVIYRSDDHSLVNSLIRSGNIGPDRAADHPNRNVINRCMRADNDQRSADDASVITLTDIADDDYLLLCSDGVTAALPEADDTLTELLSSTLSDKDKIDTLARRCIDSPDNNTAILIHIGAVHDRPTTDAADTADAPSTPSPVRTAKLPYTQPQVHDVAPKRHKSIIKSFLDKLLK